MVLTDTMSGLETKGMRAMGWSTLIPKNSPVDSQVMYLPPRKVSVEMDLGSDNYDIDLLGLSVASLQVEHHQLTVAGRCMYSREDHKHYSITMRTKEESKRQGIAKNGVYGWPDVQSFQTCPMCETRIEPSNGTTKEEYWMVLHPLMQGRNRKGTAPTFGQRVIYQLICLDCFEGNLANDQVIDANGGRLPLMEALNEMPGMPLFLEEGYNKNGTRIRGAWDLYKEWEDLGGFGALSAELESAWKVAASPSSSLLPPSKLANAHHTHCLSCKKEAEI
jgi:hypothetical protein